MSIDLDAIAKRERLPCPFCGCEATMMVVPFNDTNPDPPATVKCAACTGSVSAWAKSEAIAAWNRRVEATPARVVTVALDEEQARGMVQKSLERMQPALLRIAEKAKALVEALADDTTVYVDVTPPIHVGRYKEALADLRRALGDET
jgi:hypothetical protein